MPIIAPKYPASRYLTSVTDEGIVLLDGIAERTQMKGPKLCRWLAKAIAEEAVRRDSRGAAESTLAHLNTTSWTGAELGDALLLMCYWERDAAVEPSAFAFVEALRLAITVAARDRLKRTSGR